MLAEGRTLMQGPKEKKWNGCEWVYETMSENGPERRQSKTKVLKEWISFILRDLYQTT